MVQYISVERATNDGRNGNNLPEEVAGLPVQQCPICQTPMSALPGTRDAVCVTCGFKDPCCE